MGLCAFLSLPVAEVEVSWGGTVFRLVVRVGACVLGLLDPIGFKAINFACKKRSVILLLKYFYEY